MGYTSLRRGKDSRSLRRRVSWQLPLDLHAHHTLMKLKTFSARTGHTSLIHSKIPRHLFDFGAGVLAHF